MCTSLGRCYPLPPPAPKAWAIRSKLFSQKKIKKKLFRFCFLFFFVDCVESVLILFLFFVFIFRSRSLLCIYFCSPPRFIFVLSSIVFVVLGFVLFFIFIMLRHLHSTHPLCTLIVYLFRTFFVSTPFTGPPCCSLRVCPFLRLCSDMDSSPRWDIKSMLGPHHVNVRPTLWQC